MELIETCILGVVIVQPRIFGDERGYFFESFSQRDFERQVQSIGLGDAAAGVSGA